jgi:transcriptional regulator with XRE-family HTH domain
MIVRVSYSEGPNEAKSPGAFVRDLLIALHETQTSASKKCGINNAVLGRWIKDEMEPGIKNARKFADGLGVPRLFVMFGLGILEPRDVDLDPVLAELSNVLALLRGESERERVREQMEFVTGMARDRLARQEDSEQRERDAG